MSSVVISGDTSGSVTLQAPAVSGTTVLTLPATSGTVITTASGTAATATNLADGVAGAVPYQSGSGATGFSAAGTSGQLLQSNGASAPTWVTAGASALTLLSTVTASTSATVDVETTFSSTYDAYLLIGTGITQTSTESLNVRMKIGGTYISTATYKYHNHGMSSSDATYTAIASTGAAQIIVSNQYPSTGAEQSIDFIMRIYTPASTAFVKMIDWQGVTTDNNSPIRLLGFSGAGFNTGTGALTGMRFLFGAGNILAGKFRLYGIANS